MKKLSVIFIFLFAMIISGCGTNNYDAENQKQINVTNDMVERQPTPTDVYYSLERYNLIRRTYWVNGMREKAINLPCEVVKPLGYILLFTESGQIVGNFVVDGKVSSLRSYLTPDSEYYEGYGCNTNVCSHNYWLADVDGAYGENSDGIFFFTPDGKYLEWNGIYLFSDIPFEIDTLLTKGE